MLSPQVGNGAVRMPCRKFRVRLIIVEHDDNPLLCISNMELYGHFLNTQSDSSADTVI